MDTGCPSLLTLLPHLLPRQKQPCLAPTLEIASHLGIGVGRAAALMIVAGAIDLLREIVRSQGVTAVATGLPLGLDMSRETDIFETLHPGGETTNDLLCEGFIFPVDFRQKDI